MRGIPKTERHSIGKKRKQITNRSLVDYSPLSLKVRTTEVTMKPQVVKLETYSRILKHYSAALEVEKVIHKPGFIDYVSTRRRTEVYDEPTL